MISRNGFCDFLTDAIRGQTAILSPPPPDAIKRQRFSLLSLSLFLLNYIAFLGDKSAYLAGGIITMVAITRIGCPNV